MNLKKRSDIILLLMAKKAKWISARVPRALKMGNLFAPFSWWATCGIFIKIVSVLQCGGNSLSLFFFREEIYLIFFPISRSFSRGYPQKSWALNSNYFEEISGRKLFEGPSFTGNEKLKARYGNYRNLLSQVFFQKFREINLISATLTAVFTEYFSNERNFFVFPHCGVEHRDESCWKF